MRVFVLYFDQRHCLDVNLVNTVADMKQLLRRKFDLDTVQGEDTENDMLLTLTYAGGSLQDEWIFSDIGIPPGSTLRCELIENVKTFLNIDCVFSCETVKFTDPFTVWQTKVSDLKTMITNHTGLHVSVFRLVTSEGKELFDCNLLKDYNVGEGDTLRLETWNGWSEFLKAAIKGQLTPTLKHMISLSDDPLVAKYQQRVGLFIAAHYGYHQLAALLLKSGARSDEAVGAHPVREWCTQHVHVDHYKTPIHEAAQHGQLLCLRQFIHHNYTCILAKDGAGLTPCNIARRFRHTECFKLLIAEQFRSRTIEGLTITLYARVKKWSERARDRAVVFHKHNPSPLLLAMEQRSHRQAAVGQKVQIDGFGKNQQTAAGRMETSLVTNASRAITAGALDINTSIKPIKNIKQHSSDDIDSLNSRELQDFGENSSRRELKSQQDSVGTKRRRNGGYSLPSVLEPRYHDNRTKPSSPRRAKHKAAFNSYRWKDLEDRQIETEDMAGKKQQIMTHNMLSMPQIATGTGSLQVNCSRETKAEESPTKRANESCFVTDKGVDSQQTRVQAWTTKDDQTPHKTKLKTTGKMPAIPSNSSLLNPDKGGDAKQYKRKELPDKARREGDASHKPIGLTRKTSRGSHQRASSEDPSAQTAALYRHVTGQGRRESARASLDVAMTFNKKSWLQQVQLAIDLNTNTFKRQVLNTHED